MDQIDWGNDLRVDLATYWAWAEKYKPRLYFGDLESSTDFLPSHIGHLWFELFDGTNQLRYLVPASLGIPDDAEGFYVTELPDEGDDPWNSVPTERELLCVVCGASEPNWEEPSPGGSPCLVCGGEGTVLFEFSDIAGVSYLNFGHVSVLKLPLQTEAGRENFRPHYGQTSYASQCSILSEFYTQYKDNEVFSDFIRYNDLGLTLAVAIAGEVVLSLPKAEMIINESFQLLLDVCGAKDTGYSNLDELLFGEFA